MKELERASNTGTIPGTVLGLSITKQIIDLHDGQIEVKSQEEQGTRFTVRILTSPA